MSKPTVWSKVCIPSLAVHRGAVVVSIVALVMAWASKIFAVLPGVHFFVLTPFFVAIFATIRVTKRRGAYRDGDTIVVVDEKGRKKGCFSLGDVATIEMSLDTKRNSPSEIEAANVAFVREDGAMIASMTFDSIASRRETLAALGVVAGETRATYRAGKRALVLPFREQLVFLAILAVTLGSALALHGWTIFMYNGPLAILPVVVNVVASLSGVTVGADGLIVAKRFDRRFVPYGRVRRIEAIPGTDRLVLAVDDGVVELPTRGGRAFDAERGEVASALELALGRYREVASEACPLAAVEATGPFRRPDPTAEVLLRIAENPAVSLGSRVEAARRAIALDPRARVRVRAASAASADDAARDALAQCELGPTSERRAG